MTTRRSFLTFSGCGIGALGGYFLSPFSTSQVGFSAGTASPRRKLLHLVLPGGWDTALTTDPVVGSKRTSGNWDSAYTSTYGTYSPAGKSSLIVGEGLKEALTAFELLPTCFVNGIFMEVSAHEIALNYMLSGVPSLSRSREYPSLAAIVGAKSSAYPPHVCFGGTPPLGDTRASHPPLQSASTSMLANMLKGPGDVDAKPSVVKAGEDLIASLDSLAEKGLTSAQQSALAPWSAARSGVAAVYARNLSSLLTYSPEIKARYLNAEDYEGPGIVAGAFLTLKAGLSPYVTVVYEAGLDTHSNHFAKHLSALNRFAKTLALLAEDLNQTPDPDDTSKKLSETTVVIVSSEFARTPKLNQAGGTDHWQSGSAIVMGSGIQDGVVLGRTGINAAALGWLGGSEYELTAESALLPQHLISALVDHLGFPVESKNISATPLKGVSA